MNWPERNNMDSFFGLLHNCLNIFFLNAFQLHKISFDLNLIRPLLHGEAVRFLVN